VSEGSDATDVLVVEAMKKSSLAWISAAGNPATAVWLTWIDGAACLVHGGGEQVVPGLPDVDECLVTVRGDSGGRIVTWKATVRNVEPGTPEWDELVPQLVAKRLNLDDASDAPERWASTATVSRLVPDGAPPEAGATLPADGQREQPRPSGATTRTPIPRTVGTWNGRLGFRSKRSR
jgi:hypothetical protein